MKRIISLIVIMATLIGFAAATPVYAADTLNLVCETIEAKPGETVTVSISITNNPGIVYLSLNQLSYDTSALTLTSVANGNSNAFTFTKDVSYVFDAKDINVNETVTGDLMICTFEISKEATVGTYPIEISVYECYNSDIDDVEPSIINGAIKVVGEDIPSVGETMTGYNLTLQGGGQGDIDVNLGITMTEELRADEDAYLNVVRNGKTEKVYVSSLSFDQAGKTTFSVQTAAKNMGDEISVTVFSGSGDSGATYTYSVQSYAEYILEHSAEYDETLVSVVKAMLNYGTAAQNYFGYDTSSPVNSAMTQADKNAVALCTEVGTAADRNVILSGSHTSMGISNHTATLVLDAQTTIRHYITLENGTDISSLTFKVGDTPLTAKKEGSRYALDITDIPAAKLDDGYTLTVTSANGSYSVTYSAVNYLSRMFDSNKNDAEKTSYVDLLKAMYLYNQAAGAHFGV